MIISAIAAPACHVRYGSLAEVEARPQCVRSSPNSRHHSARWPSSLVPLADIRLFEIDLSLGAAHSDLKLVIDAALDNDAGDVLFYLLRARIVGLRRSESDA